MDSIAQAAIKLDIPLIAAIPFAGQERSWPVKFQERYKKLLNLAEQTIIVNTGGYSRENMDVQKPLDGRSFRLDTSFMGWQFPRRYRRSDRLR